MRGLKTISPLCRWVVLLVPLLWLAACSSDSPTQPRQNPQPPTGASATWNITVTASTTQVAAGNDAVLLTIVVREVGTNRIPPTNSTIVVSTSLGEFNALASGLQSIALSLINGQAQVSLFGGSSPGTATVVAQLEESTGSLQIAVVGSANFRLDRVSPTFGSPQGGQLLDIFGGGFEEPVRVVLGAIVAEVLAVEATRIQVRTPAISLPVGQTQTVDVAVTSDLNGDNQQTDALAGVYTYSHGSLNQPQVFSVTPRSGPNEGGTRVVILGDGFESPAQVLFGSGSPESFDGVEATIESVTRTQIVAITPSATAFGQDNMNSAVSILVRNQGSGLSALAASAFEYGVQVIITSIGPSTGPFFGGQLVTIFGQGFDEPAAVSLGGFGQAVLSVTGTEIVVRTVPITSTDCMDVAGPAGVTNVEDGNSNQTDGPIYVYQVTLFTPSISLINPTTGTIAGGTRVTITGANFRPPMAVFFGQNRPGNIISITDTQIVVDAPFFPERSLEEEGCDDNADGTEGMRFIPTAVDVLVVNQATTCTATFMEGFFYTPTNTTCRDDVGPVMVDPPMADFEFTIVGATQSVQFQDRSMGTAPFTYQWDFETDGAIDDTSANPLHDYGAAASGMTFTVTLTVTNAAGSSSVSMNVGPLP